MAGKLGVKRYYQQGEKTYEFRGGLLIIGSYYNGGNLYSVGYDTITPIYQAKNQNLIASGELSISGYSVKLRTKGYVYYISTDQDALG